MSLFHRCFFKHFASQIQLSGFFIHGTLELWLEISKKQSDFKYICIYQSYQSCISYYSELNLYGFPLCAISGKDNSSTISFSFIHVYHWSLFIIYHWSLITDAFSHNTGTHKWIDYTQHVPKKTFNSGIMFQLTFKFYRFPMAFNSVLYETQNT